VELRPSVSPGQPTLSCDAGSAPLCRGMSDRPPRPPRRRSLGQARWSGPPTPPSQATQAQDALNQELPAGLPTLAIDVNNSHSCCWMITGPNAPQWTTLGSGPQGRSSDPSDSAPSQAQDTLSPARPEAHRAAVAHRPSVPLGKLRVNRVSSQRQFPVWLTGHQCPGTKCAIRVNTGSVPRVAHRSSVPHTGAVCCPASRAFFATDDQVCSS
jgi:hypothetical protein